MTVICSPLISEEEKNKIVETIIQKHKSRQIEGITINVVDDDYVDVDITFSNVHFERIRRITGYLVGTVDRWNNGKRAELNDRQKHSV